MNPLCQCGCGREVRKPQNRYVLGHGSFKRRAMTDEQVMLARQLREEGLSQAAIAKRFGTSQATIYNRIDAGSYVPPEKHVYTPVTQAEMDLKWAVRTLRDAIEDVLICSSRFAAEKRRAASARKRMRPRMIDG